MRSSTLILAFVFALALGQCQSSAVSPGPGASSPPSLGELLTKAQTDIVKIRTNIFEDFIRPNYEAVVNALKERSMAFFSNIQGFFQQMTKDAMLLNLELLLKTLTRYVHSLRTESPEIGKIWDDLKNGLIKAKEELSAENPVASDEISKLQSKLVEGIGSIAKHLESAVTDKNLINTAKEKVDQIKGDVANLATEVKSVVETAKEVESVMETTKGGVDKRTGGVANLAKKVGSVMGTTKGEVDKITGGVAKLAKDAIAKWQD